MKKQILLVTILALALGMTLALHAAGPQITVYKLATCDCCGQWVEHLKANGFQATVHQVPRMEK